MIRSKIAALRHIYTTQRSREICGIILQLVPASKEDITILYESSRLRWRSISLSTAVAVLFHGVFGIQPDFGGFLHRVVVQVGLRSGVMTMSSQDIPNAAWKSISG
jgi:hypothetical protein